ATRVTTPKLSPPSATASRTMRTARSRSSGGYRRWLGCLLVFDVDIRTPLFPRKGVSIEPRAVQAVDDLLPGASLSDVARRWRTAVGQPQTGRPNWTTDGVRQVVSNPRNAGLVGHRQKVRSDRPYQLHSRPEVVGVAK